MYQVKVYRDKRWVVVSEHPSLKAAKEALETVPPGMYWVG